MKILIILTINVIMIVRMEIELTMINDKHNIDDNGDHGDHDNADEKRESSLARLRQ